MKSIESVKEIQDISYNLLKKFHLFCESNNLRYILAGGTLLGAIRHNDFIPWDDDIDVQMPRPDYEKFIQLAQNGIGDNTKLVNKDNIQHPYFTFSKIIDTRTVLYENISVPNEIGVFIDVFPTDGLPDSQREIKKKFKKLAFYKNILSIRLLLIKKGKTFKTTLAKIVLIPIVRLLFDPEKLVNKIIAISNTNDFEKSRLVAFQVLGYNEKEITEKEKYLNRVLVKFRDEMFYAPSNYDCYLRQLYGDYMELPPVEQRITHHGFKAYWRDR